MIKSNLTVTHLFDWGMEAGIKCYNIYSTLMSNRMKSNQKGIYNINYIKYIVFKNFHEFSKFKKPKSPF